MEPEVDSLETDAAPDTDSAVETQTDTTAEVDTAQDPAPADSSQPSVQTETEAWTPPAREQWEATQREFEQYKARLAETQRAFHERSQLLKQYEGIDPNVVNAWREQQQMAQQRSLPLWSPQHPEHAKFQEARQRYTLVQKQLKALPPDVDPAIKQQIVQATLSEQDIKVIEDFRSHQEELQHRLATDPMGAIEEHVNRLLEQRLAEREQKFAAKNTVDNIFSQHGETLERHREDVVRFLTAQGQDRVMMATEYVQMKEQLAKLQQQLQPAQAQAVQAKEQQRLLQQSATHQTSVSKGVKPSWEDFLKDRGYNTRNVPFRAYAEYENI